MSAAANVLDLVERAAIRAADGIAKPAELRLLEQHARAYRSTPLPTDWAQLARVNTLTDALSVCSGLGMHTHLLHGVQDDGRCRCGGRSPQCDQTKGDAKSRGKHPIARKWQEVPFDLDKMTAQVSREPARYNLGWRMGEQLDGSIVVCFDIDGAMSLLDPLEARFGKLPATLTASSGRGFHLFFRLAEASAIPGNVKLCGVKEIDIRSVGGQVVIAPSRHFSGTDYKWVRCVEPAELDL